MIHNQKQINLSYLKDKTISCEFSNSDGDDTIIQLSYPFSSIQNIKHDLVLVPSKGNFLDNYNNDTGLHIAIISGLGEILEYDSNGVRISDCKAGSQWQQCVAVDLLNKLFVNRKNSDRSIIESTWDQALNLIKLSNHERWSVKNYDCQGNNCFDFVLKFLQFFIRLLSKEQDIETSLRDSLHDKTIFCEQFLVPETKRVSRYISAYRKIFALESNKSR